MKMTIERIGRTVKGDWQCNEYKVFIKNDGEQFTTPFYTGTGWKEDPTDDDVLESLLSDMRAGEMTFEEFCDDFGDDPESPRSRKTHKACERTSAAMRRVFSQDELDALEAQVEKRNE